MFYNGDHFIELFKFHFKTNQSSDMLIIQIPTGSRDHEIIVLIVTCVLLTFLSFSVAKCVRRRITETCSASNRSKQQQSGNDDIDADGGNGGDDNEANANEQDDGNDNENQNETKDLNPKSRKS